jgi:hypothetical protein
MRFVRTSTIGLIVALAACSNNDGVTNSGAGATLASPTGLTYQLTRSPVGVLLSWLAPADSNVSAFAVFGRDSTSSNTAWNEIGITISTTYHLTTPIDSEYYVTSEDIFADQSSPSSTLVINLADSVQTPGDLRGTAFDSAVTVGWDSIAQVGFNASRFQSYNLYSMPVTSGPACDTTALSIEGTTTSTAFVITGLQNGISRCYTVTSVSLSGEESPFASPFVMLTPSASDPAFAAGHVPSVAVITAEHRRLLKGRVARTTR